MYNSICFIVLTTIQHDIMFTVAFTHFVTCLMSLKPIDEGLTFDQALALSTAAQLTDDVRITRLLISVARSRIDQFTEMFFDNLAFIRPSRIVQQLEKLVKVYGDKNAFKPLLDQITKSKEDNIWHSHQLKLGFSTSDVKITMVFGELGLDEWWTEKMVADDVKRVDIYIVRRPVVVMDMAL